MYEKYQTDAIVLASWENGEADKVYALFTHEFGLVRARASAVRRENSKMRYALQDYSLASVSLVRGKRNWRVAGTRALEGLAVTENLKGAQTFGRVADLVTKLVTGEERNEYLYETLLRAREALIVSKFNLEPAIPAIEILSVARILYALGYISAEALDTALFTHADFAAEVLREAELKRPKLLASINQALSETQLVRR
jgi:recombinational DNA repair protein (RecF pathway)